jgi:hypothetical protein
MENLQCLILIIQTGKGRGRLKRIINRQKIGSGLTGRKVPDPPGITADRAANQLWLDQLFESRGR